MKLKLDHLSDVAPPRTKAPCHTVPKVDMTGAASIALQPLDGALTNALSSTVQYMFKELHDGTKEKGGRSIRTLRIRRHT